MMINTQLLDEKITDSGLKISYICDKLGLSRNGFNKKRKGEIPFKKPEIYLLSVILNLTEEDGNNIFMP